MAADVEQDAGSAGSPLKKILQYINCTGNPEYVDHLDAHIGIYRVFQNQWSFGISNLNNIPSQDYEAPMVI